MDRGYKKPVTNTDNKTAIPLGINGFRILEIAIPLGMKRIPDSMNYY